MCHIALGFCTGSPQSPTTDDLALSLKSYVTRPSSKKRRYMFRRISLRTLLTLNSPQIFMIKQSSYTPHRSLMITATLIPTAVPLLLVNHKHPRFRRSTREQRVIRPLPAPLRTSNIPVTAIITMFAVMVIITIATGSEHRLLLLGVEPTVHPLPRMYTPMVIRDNDLFHASHPSALPVKVFYMAAFDLLVVQQPPKGVRLFAGHTSTASTGAKMPTGKTAWWILRVLREFQSTVA
jgi:hypothetical protein